MMIAVTERGLAGPVGRRNGVAFIRLIEAAGWPRQSLLYQVKIFASLDLAIRIWLSRSSSCLRC
jgi:hypothetical protein